MLLTASTVDVQLSLETANVLIIRPEHCTVVDTGGTNMSSSDDNFFGLTDDEYEILLEDIEQAVEEGNRKYGYGYGYCGYVESKSNARPKPKRRRGLSVEQVAIARGIIKVISSPSFLVPVSTKPRKEK